MALRSFLVRKPSEMIENASTVRSSSAAFAAERHVRETVRPHHCDVTVMVAELEPGATNLSSGVFEWQSFVVELRVEHTYHARPA